VNAAEKTRSSPLAALVTFEMELRCEGLRRDVRGSHSASTRTPESGVLDAETTIVDPGASTITFFSLVFFFLFFFFFPGSAE